MTRLFIQHVTQYHYDNPVSLTPHRLLIRPRDSHALRLLDASLRVSPPGPTVWRYDALGNCVCVFEPQGQTNGLTITSTVTVERFPAPLSERIDDPASAFPVFYSPNDYQLLEPMLMPVTEDMNRLLADWIRDFARAGEPALDMIRRMTGEINGRFDYRARYEPGVQTPVQTLQSRSGTCRDFAWLMVEALRRLGFAARFVTGYLYSPNAQIRGAGATHAWCEAFLPSLGWLEFDPTNGLAESADLIPVAVARTPGEALPISGGLIGNPGNSTMNVSVNVSLAS